jgi:NADH:ubiquinone reductase (non-electrogenic)
MAGTTQGRSVVVLGSGFAAMAFLRRVSGEAHHLTVVSPRNHFLFTPLLPSTTVGTLEFRSIVESVRTACPAALYYQAEATAVDPEAHMVRCHSGLDGTDFALPYDRLVIAVGATTNTYGIPGVREHAHFLKELVDARTIRSSIIECFERAAHPGVSRQDQERLLHFVVVGGGPTGVEFAAELNDFIVQDLRRPYAHLVDGVTITLLEAGPHILTSFDAALQSYTMNFFHRQRIQIRTRSPVVNVGAGSIALADGSELDYGMLVWTAGVIPDRFIQHLAAAKASDGRLLTDEFLRLKSMADILAMGDCMTIEGQPFPSTAQTAQQMGKYLARSFNRTVSGRAVVPFRYRHYGMLAYIGRERALADLSSVKGRGFSAWLFWRSAYLTKIVSVRNKILVLFDWVKTFTFGRDLSKF